ncbi:MAG: hypothetical protein UY41_C0022G0002 [Candidatus Moranbacteria bacterium GW2011_GWE1_49_15]|nr:MAG: hypothetical protein UX75_C0041G0010 [Candidatus Moranbacteria bacterium GW2011_GWE2_47_10]KKW06523.1 MAG: hypothetical protein UY41_C0022G0002 [Candidatus Moranbacteria bacterium GW2011_GWE1_49_15]HBP01016.1 hypothetical protein [Candidatus Moranbacteria bacterium]
MQANKPPHDNLLHFLTLLIGVGFGYLIFALSFNGFNFTIAKDVGIQFDFFQVVSLAVTAWLAVYVLRRLNKKDEFKKMEIKILADYFIDFRKEFEAVIKELLSEKEMPLILITSQMKNYRTRLEMLVNTAEQHKMIEKDSLLTSKLKGKLYDILGILTYTPSKQDPEGTYVTVKNGNVAIHQEQIDKTYAKLYETQRSIFEVIIEINKST